MSRSSRFPLYHAIYATTHTPQPALPDALQPFIMQMLHPMPISNPYSYTLNPLSINQSHLPSPHPVLHLSSHLPQSNSPFPNFLLTSLCASHIHLPSSPLPLTLGSFPSLFIQAWKSSAHTQHGYSFENRERNCRISVCWVGVAVGG